MSQAEADTQKQLILTTNAKLFISVFYNVFQVLNSSNTKMSISESSLKYKYEVWLALRSLALDNMIYKCLLSKKCVQMQFFYCMIYFHRSKFWRYVPVPCPRWLIHENLFPILQLNICSSQTLSSTMSDVFTGILKGKSCSDLWLKQILISICNSCCPFTFIPFKLGMH